MIIIIICTFRDYQIGNFCPNQDVHSVQSDCVNGKRPKFLVNWLTCVYKFISHGMTNKEQLIKQFGVKFLVSKHLNWELLEEQCLFMLNWCTGSVVHRFVYQNCWKEIPFHSLSINLCYTTTGTKWFIALSSCCCFSLLTSDFPNVLTQFNFSVYIQWSHIH